MLPVDEGEKAGRRSVGEKNCEEGDNSHEHGVSQHLEVTQSSFVALSSGTKFHDVPVLQINAFLECFRRGEEATVLRDQLFKAPSLGFQGHLAFADRGLDVRSFKYNCAKGAAELFDMRVNA